ncbi:MAG: hypothetical protein K8T91_20130, partial [Planctomycetes bacterium]|nr:hypothetical protein [Planctomycetota bacterium]
MKLPDKTQSLLDAFLAGCATPEQEAELDRSLPADPELRAAFCEAVETEVLLSTWAAGRQEEHAAQSVLREMGSESSLTRSVSEGVGVQPLDCPVEKQAKAWTPTRRASEDVPQGDSPTFTPQTSITVVAQKLGQSPTTFHISAIAAVVAFITIGILAYAFWPGPSGLQVVQQTPAAKIAGLTDAKWAGASSQPGDTLVAGQQLLLQNGSVEITFNNQARVIVSGPVELTIVDAGACRLTTGKLT